MNNRGRGVRNTRTSGTRAQVQMLKSSLHGHENVLKATNPPPFNRKPYNTITIEKVFTGTSGLQTVTVSSILSAIRAQLDLAEPAPIMFKMQRIDLWVMASGSNDTPSIRGKFYSLVSNSSDAAMVPDRVPLKFLEDQGTYGASAAVVYTHGHVTSRTCRLDQSTPRTYRFISTKWGPASRRLHSLCSPGTTSTGIPWSSSPSPLPHSPHALLRR